MFITLLIALNLIGWRHAKYINDNFERHMFPCHTTDFTCFKRQYTALRDHALLGNAQLGIDVYKPYLYKYGDSGTCIRLSGIEESELVSISFNSISKELSMTIDMPFRIRQVRSDTENCEKPDREFEGVGPYKGSLKRFSGNATLQITYPYTLRKVKEDTYISLHEENLDVILDIPDLSHFNKQSKFEAEVYQRSEWAYHVVQHTNVAQNVLLPFTEHIRTVTDRFPLKRFLLLYPDEKYSDLNFTFDGTS